MKGRYAQPAFFLAVFLLWLSLLLTTHLQSPAVSPQDDEGAPVSYTELQGIDSLELHHSNEEKERYYNSHLLIRYANQPHITVKIKNLSNSESSIKRLFIRRGNFLIFQPEFHQPLNETSGNNKYIFENEKPRVTEIILPIHIGQLRTHGISLYISSKNKQNTIKIPSLHVEMKNSKVEFNHIGIGSLSIRNQYTKENCRDKRTHTYFSGAINIEEEINIGTLFVESIYGHIELKNSVAIQSMHLKTTPETSIMLDRMDIYPRMHWEPLPTPSLPKCKGGAERTTAPPSMKAQQSKKLMHASTHI